MFWVMTRMVSRSGSGRLRAEAGAERSSRSPLSEAQPGSSERRANSKRRNSGRMKSLLHRDSWRGQVENAAGRSAAAVGEFSSQVGFAAVGPFFELAVLGEGGLVE